MGYILKHYAGFQGFTPTQKFEGKIKGGFRGSAHWIEIIIQKTVLNKHIISVRHSFVPTRIIYDSIGSSNLELPSIRV